MVQGLVDVMDGGGARNNGGRYIFCCLIFLFLKRT